MRKRARVGTRDRGAAAVEMALIAPLLLLLLLGIVEFGYIFGQFNEVRHAVRETARYAAVSNPDRDGDGDVDSADVIQVACDSLNLPASTFDLTVTVTSGSGAAVGDLGTVTITANLQSLTNAPLITTFLPTTITNSAEFRIEQPIKWNSPVSGTGLSC